MARRESPSVWLQQLRDGESVAAHRLWETYFQKLVRLARRQLHGRARLVGDEEDVALSALKSFFRGIERGQFPQVNDRNDLWNLLATITLHKVLHLVRDEGRQKRGGGQKFVDTAPATSDRALLQQLVGSEPTPELAAQVAEEAERLLASLPNQELLELALLKLEGYSNGEIAVRWQRTERTVERKLNMIRTIWEKSAPKTG